MARPPRLDLPGITQHVVQRAVDRRPCFLQDMHYSLFLNVLESAADLHSCDLHAYVLMCNHIHLLVTPHEAGGVGRLMHAVSSKFVGFVNYTVDRSGPLWQGRYKSCLVGNDRYALACYRYIESNPTRAGIVDQPGAYRWSSYTCNGLGKTNSLLRPHPAYTSLGVETNDRLRAYRELFQTPRHREECEIRSLTSLNRAFGDETFRLRLEKASGRPMSPQKLGRPRKAREVESESGA